MSEAGTLYGEWEWDPEGQWDPEEAAARGAAFLDERIPTWHRDVRGAIVDGSFDMEEWDHCVVGKVERIRVEWDPEYMPDDPVQRRVALPGAYVLVFNGTRIAQWGPEVLRYGFIPPRGRGSEAYTKLQRAWEAEVAKRA